MVHLDIKIADQTKPALRNFYSNNKEDSNKLRTKTDSLGNESLAQKGKGVNSDEFSALNSPVNFFSNFVTLERIVSQYGFD
ncbi:hypothetical protein [Wolbachia pipientis]|uniref:hypothetical protein n=1 Tax=Wolbachia pipientis TaxID=955 RepID=UPI0025A31BFC|nr:hypothetical protein [Wolbachia pipientis]MDM8334899.1 hypothetical protein [Wolbachia pipientis]